MNQRGLSGLGVPILVFCLLSMAGCVGLVTKEFQLYPGPSRPADQIAKSYLIVIERQAVEKMTIAENESTTKYLVGTIEITFRICEQGTGRIVSRRAD